MATIAALWQPQWESETRPDWLMYIQPTEPMFITPDDLPLTPSTFETMPHATVTYDLQASVLGKRRRRASCNNGVEVHP